MRVLVTGGAGHFIDPWCGVSLLSCATAARNRARPGCACWSRAELVISLILVLACFISCPCCSQSCAGPDARAGDGRAGFIGSHLVDRLMERGCDVIVVDNFFTGTKDNLRRWSGTRSWRSSGTVRRSQCTKEAIAQKKPLHRSSDMFSRSWRSSGTVSSHRRSHTVAQIMSQHAALRRWCDVSSWWTTSSRAPRTTCGAGSGTRSWRSSGMASAIAQKKSVHRRSHRVSTRSFQMLL